MTQNATRTWLTWGIGISFTIALEGIQVPRWITAIALVVVVVGGFWWFSIGWFGERADAAEEQADRIENGAIILNSDQASVDVALVLPLTGPFDFDWWPKDQVMGTIIENRTIRFTRHVLDQLGPRLRVRWKLVEYASHTARSRRSF